MKRLTTDHPEENFDKTLNYVFGKDGWAYIRSNGESEDPILLTEWARKQCIARGCDELPTDPEGIDESISDFAFCAPECPVFLAYTFACQAVHLRDRLKQIEDILGDNYDVDHLKELVQAENDGRLIVLPEVPEADRKLFEDNLHDVFTEWADYASAGIFDMSEGECALAKAIMKALTREEAQAALAEEGEENA